MDLRYCPSHSKYKCQEREVWLRLWGEGGARENNVWAQRHCRDEALTATPFRPPKMPGRNIPVLFNETN